LFLSFSFYTETVASENQYSSSRDKLHASFQTKNTADSLEFIYILLITKHYRNFYSYFIV